MERNNNSRPAKRKTRRWVSTREVTDTKLRQCQQHCELTELGGLSRP